MSERKRAVLVVMDSLGVGAMPDAAEYGDAGSSTINHIVEKLPEINIPNLINLGFGNIEGVEIPGGKNVMPEASYGRAAELSSGKDTITGHWELAGIITETPFQTFTDTGFPEAFIKAFEDRIGRKVLGNYSSSGTEIIEKWGEEHKKTGYPIVYTSADSVFQIAANTAVIPLEELYEICQAARELLVGEFLVGRVIARPFTEENGVYTRTSDRRDYSVDPPKDTVLDEIKNAGLEVCAVGKISDIFNDNGITQSIHTKDNMQGVDAVIDYLKRSESGLIFANLVDFDAKYGHRRDPEGYGHAIEEFDARIPDIMAAMGDKDILILCADHGNDPVHEGWNHTREYIPVIIYGKEIMVNNNLGTLSSFADVGATICDYLGVPTDGAGESILDRILK
ncbi:MAG: phosphopentomutase [Firmicutes bacterium]|nr:phosphopentomutase [Bacillota bacterium]